MTKSKECIFCEIVAGRENSHKICEDDLSLCILDINPFTEGHCLIIPKRHVPWWHDLNDREIESLFKIARTVAKKMLKEYKADFICMYARGRRIPHTHIFLVPTASDDLLDRFFNALEKFQESPPVLIRHRSAAALKRTAQRLREKNIGKNDVSRMA